MRPRSRYSRVSSPTVREGNSRGDTQVDRVRVALPHGRATDTRRSTMSVEITGSAGVPETASRAVTKVAIVEDQQKFRECLRILIDGTDGFRCAGIFRSMEEALHRIGFDLPDVALVDIGLPGMSGIDGIRILKDRHPNIRLLMLTVYDDDQRIFEALCAGATGYLLKKTPPTRL